MRQVPQMFVHSKMYSQTIAFKPLYISVAISGIVRPSSTPLSTSLRKAKFIAKARAILMNEYNEEAKVGSENGGKEINVI